MATITIQVPRSEYPSLQVGDTAYYSKIVVKSEFNTSDNFVKIGLVKSINNTTSLTCEIDTDTPNPTENDFIFFSKDNKVNLTSLVGYFASMKFKNNSTSKAELFSISCEIAESSK